VMNRFDLTCRLVTQLNRDEAVIGGIGNSNFDLWNAGPRPQNFYMLGSMGLAVPIALGVALAQPDRKVFALEGDGSLLMQLGVLTTVANLKPRNLTIVVWDNAMYQITGLQPTAAAGLADFVAIARGAGLERCAWAADEADFAKLVARSLAEDGPWFIAAKIDSTAPKGQTPREPVIIKDRFTRAMAVKP
jgi:thiamine pyrophosphate-dependent acetolactate synthase large subunit-like protein